jgi:hypothetical protein
MYYHACDGVWLGNEAWQALADGVTVPTNSNNMKLFFWFLMPCFIATTGTIFIGFDIKG